MIQPQAENKEIKILIGSYQRVFRGGASAEDCDRVYKDLEKRCYEHETTFDDNHGRMGFKEGRRSIFTRIKNMVNARPDELAELPRTY